MKGRVSAAKRAKNHRVSEKIREMRHEGYRGDVAAAAAYSMDKKHELGPEGEYTRKTHRPKGPRGKQRSTSK